MPEADPLALHHPLDHIATLVTGPQAMLQVLLRGDHQAGFLVVMEGTQPQVVLAVFLQDNAGGFHQPHQRDLTLEAVQFFCGIRAINRVPPKSCQDLI